MCEIESSLIVHLTSLRNDGVVFTQAALGPHSIQKHAADGYTGGVDLIMYMFSVLAMRLVVELYELAVGGGKHEVVPPTTCNDDDAHDKSSQEAEV